MEYFVFYYDDYPESGGVGLASFNTEDEALAFIAARVAAADYDAPRRAAQYTLIRGTQLELEDFERVVSVRIKMRGIV